MIPVSPAPEPSTFDAQVRRRGHLFLRMNPRPANNQWKKAKYWTSCLPELRRAYRNICSYAACWIPTSTTVDHYYPKKIRPDLAYEWSNYRLALDKMNSYKGESREVADPFCISPGWFIIDFNNFYIVPGKNLDPDVRRMVINSIEILKMNSDDTLVDLRFTVVQDYALGNTNLGFLKSRFPFIYSELVRQDLVSKIKARFI